MNRKRYILFSIMTAAIMPLWGCGSSGSGGDSTVGVATATDPESLFIGSETCKTCHESIYNDFIESGHPYKLNKVVDNQVPTYPFSSINGALALVTDEDGQTDNSLGTPGTYSDVTYVIGGYGWKARWVDADGYIVTGSAVQYNLADGSMAGYHDDEVDKKYNCGNCHTTGWKHHDDTLNSNRQDDLPGMDGTFVAGGVQCESCHGPGAKHVGSLDPNDIVKVADARTTSDFLASDMGYGKAVACSECHTRDGEKDYPDYKSPAQKAGYSGNEGGRIVSNGTTGKHHQQYDEMLGLLPEDFDVNGDGTDEEALTPLGKHLRAGLTCTTCHDPHKSTKHQTAAGESGLWKECTECHPSWEVPMPTGSAMADLDCTSCHMPLLAKSAVWTDDDKKFGDIKSHIFRIDLSQTAQLTDDNAFVYPWITADYACGSCHNGDDAFDLSGADLSEYSFHQDHVDDTLSTPQYAGSAACAYCHEDNYNDFILSGHPYKLNKVVDDSVPTYPFSDLDPSDDGVGVLADLTDDNGETDNSLGTPASYADVSYVIGGYGWKARWVDAAGYIVTGSAVQYNLADGSWSGYHNDEEDKKYNCGNCHTTGWKHYDADDNPNRQDGLPGMDGTFAAGGVGCEACHGAGLRHIGTKDASEITEVATARTTADFLADDMGYGLPVACGECHTRDGEKDYPTYLSAANATGYNGAMGGRIVSNGTTGKHHQQYDELLGLLPEDYDVDDSGIVEADEVALTAQGLHLENGVTCTSCHDPHATTKYQNHADNTSSGSGVEVACTSCHTMAFTNTGSTHEGTDCIVCHMPKLAKSAIWTGTNAAGVDLGDIRSHIFKIDLSTTDQIYTDGDGDTFVYPWITPDYACGTCHDDPAAKVTSLNNNFGGTIHQ